MVLWIIESPSLFRKYIGELKYQIGHKDGSFILSDSDKQLDVEKCMDIVISPMEIDVNNKKFINKVYSKLKDISVSEEYYIYTRELIGRITEYFLNIEKEMEIDLDYEEVDFNQLLKSLGVKIYDYDGDIIEKIGQYLHISANLLKKKVIAFVNLSTYLEIYEIEEIIKEANYLKINLILIENHEIDLSMNKKCYIIDKDNCEIF